MKDKDQLFPFAYIRSVRLAEAADKGTNRIVRYEQKAETALVWMSDYSFSGLFSYLFAGQMKDTLWSRLRRFFPCFSIPAHTHNRHTDPSNKVR